jgi:hypothetical protein
MHAKNVPVRAKNLANHVIQILFSIVSGNVRKYAVMDTTQTKSIGGAIYARANVKSATVQRKMIVNFVNKIISC